MTGKATSLITEGLDPDQLEGACAPPGPLLVAAGAGSGKTRVLAHRAAWLIAEKGIAPERILAVTFTKKATEQMRSRIANVLEQATGTNAGLNQASQVQIATIHSMCSTMLRRLTGYVDINHDYEVADTRISKPLFHRAVNEMGGRLMKGEIKKDGDRKIGELFSQLGRGKAKMFTAEELALSSNQHEAEFGRVWLRHQQLLRASNLLDFEDMITLTVQALEKDEIARRQWAGKWDAVLVDEAQDLSEAQYRWIRALTRDHLNVTLVGDPSQSIYSFRGADPSQLASFTDHYPDGKIVKLGTNYRCSEAVVAHARRLLEHDKERIPIDITSGRGEQGEVALRSFTDPEDEAKAVAAMIVAKAEQHPLEEIAVLARNTAYLNTIEDALKKADISFVLLQDSHFWELDFIQLALGHLRLAINPGNEVLFSQVVREWPGLGDAATDALIDVGRQAGNGDFVSLLASAGNVGLHRAQATAAEGLYQQLRAIAAFGAHGRLADAMHQAIRGSGALQQVEAITDPRSSDRARTKLRDLWSMADDYEHGALGGQEVNGPVDIFGLLDELAAIARSSTIRRRSVTLGTVHAAKGLEWEIVFLVGLAQDVLPGFRSLATGEEAALDEERRIAYVALTRGGFECHISYPTQMRGYQKRMSQFVPEMGIHTPTPAVA